MDVIGPEHRFKMSRLLIEKFLTEFHGRIKLYLERDFGEKKVFRL